MIAKLLGGLRGRVASRPRRDKRLDGFLEKVLPAPLARDAISIDDHIQEGRFQRSLSLVAGGFEHFGRPRGFL